MMTPAEQIREIRAATGLSQAAFSERFGIPRRTVEDWERDLRLPPPYVITLLRAAVEREMEAK